MSKLPAFQFYPGDWLQDAIAGCSLAAQGLWLRMMFIAHNSDRYGYLMLDGKPLSPEAIARRCGCSLEQYLPLLAELDDASIPSRTKAGVIFSRRMVRDAEKRAENRMYQSTHRKTLKEKENSKSDVRQMSGVSSSSSSTTKKEQIPSRAKKPHEVDPRHVPFKLACETYMTYKRATFVWDASEAKALDLLLKACPTLTLSQFQTCLNHRGKSPGVPHGERPRIWLPNVLKYQEGPLNEFGKTGVSHGNRNQSKTGGNLDAATQAIAFLEQEERNRPTADEFQPEAAGVREPGDTGLVRGGPGASGTGGLGKCIDGTLQTATP